MMTTGLSGVEALVLLLLPLALLYLVVTTAVRNGVRDGILAARRVHDDEKEQPLVPPDASR